MFIFGIQSLILKHFIKKYFTLIFAVLVLLANVNFAFSQALCSMKMQKGCYCEESIKKDLQTEFSKKDCCKEVRKEINNTSNFQSAQNEYNYEFVCIITLPADVKLFSKTSFSNSTLYHNQIPPGDIPILNSTFRI